MKYAASFFGIPGFDTNNSKTLVRVYDFCDYKHCYPENETLANFHTSQGTRPISP